MKLEICLVSIRSNRTTIYYPSSWSSKLNNAIWRHSNSGAQAQIGPRFVKLLFNPLASTKAGFSSIIPRASLRVYYVGNTALATSIVHMSAFRDGFDMAAVILKTMVPIQPSTVSQFKVLFWT